MAKPWQTRQEMLVDQALEAAISDPETIRSIRPVVPQVLFPDTRGITKQEPTVFDALNLSRQGPTYRSWISGIHVMRTSNTDTSFTGSGRYSMDAMWSGN
jgi:hypothetical protein